jgi:hypothetical protein
MLKRKMAASLGLSATAARDWQPPTVPDRRPQPDWAAVHRELCPPEVRASSSPSCAIDATMTLVNGSQTFFAE